MQTNLKTAMALSRNCNVTLGNMKSLETPIGMLLQIEVLVIFAGFLLLFLVAFGSWRRFYNSSMFRLVIFLVYTLSTYVLTYALGLMNDAPFRSELFPIWAMFLMLVLGSADSITAYSLEDNEQWRRHNWQIQFKLIWVTLLIVMYFRNRSKVAITATVFLALILILKSDERARALMAASRQSLERTTKVLHDYMSKEHGTERLSPGEVDPVSMTECTYLVRGEEWGLVIDRIFAISRRLGMDVTARAPHYRMVVPEPQSITVGKVWTCEGGLLSPQGDPHNKLKDLCFSFALFKLLRLRYAGYSLPQEAHENARKLIRDEFLSQKDGYERVFRTVEVELNFLYDFFYTKYNIIFQLFWFVNKFMELIYVIAGIWATTSLLKHYKRPNSNCRLTTMPNGLSVDVLVTSVMIILFIIVELMQFVFFVFSDWDKVILICNYVQVKSWHGKVWAEKMIRGICGIRLLKPWERKLRQYTFLKSYSYKPCWLLNNTFLVAYIDQHRDGQKQSRPIKLGKEVKQAVFKAAFDALKPSYRVKLKNGLVSLRTHNVLEKLSWACRFETHTQVIMVWHIATTFCEYQLPVGRSDSSVMRTNFLVATSLSKYLAYLVAFAPRLLPDHPYIVEYVFDQVIIEARQFFKDCKTMEERVSKLKNSGNSKDEIDVIKRGAALGNHLADDQLAGGPEHMDEIWEILADFWVELVLYVAPSDDARAHAEHLTRGGEFVTHLWALLSHAGIERDPSPEPHSAHNRSDTV